MPLSKIVFSRKRSPPTIDGKTIDHTLSSWGATECLRGPQYGGGVGGGLAWPDPNLQKSRGQIPTSLAPAGASKNLNFEDHSAVGKVHFWPKTWEKSKNFRLAADYFLVVSRFAFELKIPLACLVEVTISFFPGFYNSIHFSEQIWVAIEAKIVRSGNTVKNKGLIIKGTCIGYPKAPKVLLPVCIGQKSGV